MSQNTAFNRLDMKLHGFKFHILLGPILTVYGMVYTMRIHTDRWKSVGQLRLGYVSLDG